MNSSREVPCNGLIKIEPMQLTKPLISISSDIIFEKSLGSGVFARSITSYLQLYFSDCSLSLSSSLPIKNISSLLDSSLAIAEPKVPVDPAIMYIYVV